MKKSHKLIPVFISMIIVVIGISAYHSGIRFLDIVELKTVDIRFKARGKIDPGPKVVIAAVDEKSLDREGKWVWPRSKIADLITKLSNAGASVIAFDIGFVEPDPKISVRIIEEIQKKMYHFELNNESFEKYLDELKVQTDEDHLLVNAIKKAKSKIVLGYFFQTEFDKSVHMDEKQLLAHKMNIRGSEYNIIKDDETVSENDQFIKAVVPYSNIQSVSEATRYSGFFNTRPDRDGVVRHMPAVIRFKDGFYAPLSLKALSVFLNQPLSIKISAEYGGVQEIWVGDIFIPTDRGQMMINYRWKDRTFPHVSITDILNGNTPDHIFKDKIVLVGVTAVGLHDMCVTPLQERFPGIEVHANIIDSILAKDFLSHPLLGEVFDILAIISAGLVLGFVLPRTGAIIGALAGITFFAGHIWLCSFLFEKMGWMLNLVYPLAVLVPVYTAITAYKYVTEEGQKKFIRNAFSTYLAPSVVKQLMDSPEKLVLGGEQRVITAFFSDVQGFTGISEKLDPKELVELLNEFLTEMTDIILKHEGTVDKFEGDAIIAFFGAPNDMKNHAETAVIASLEMQARLVQLRTAWKHQGKADMKMRIGLCSGPAVVGNMGSKNRMDYTMMGDTVNTASRLEGVNKIYGTFTIISDATYKKAGNRILFREIDTIYVVGKKEPVAIYEPLGYNDSIKDSTASVAKYYAEGLNAYRNRDWETAIQSFNSVLNIFPNDGPGNVMRNRCLSYKENPPDEQWNGVFILDKK